MRLLADYIAKAINGFARGPELPLSLVEILIL